MSAFLRRFIGAIGGLVLAVALPSRSAAVQLGGTINFDTGPVDWDQAGGPDPLLNGALEASYGMPRVLGLRPELLGEFALSTRPVERAAVRWDLGARLHTGGTRGGVWLGAAIGAAGTWNRRTDLTRLEGGIRRAVGPARINVWLSRTGFGARVAPQDGLGQESPDTLTRKGVTEYAELGSLATLRLRRYELGLSLTRRLGGAGVRRTGWDISATWWVVPSVGVVGSAGHSLPRFGFTVPGARYGTVGLRLALGARSPAEQARRSAAVAKSITGPTLAVADRLLTVRWAPARRAEVMGDFTDWKAELLIPLGRGRWTHSVALSPGVHHLNVRFDGGAWLVPSGAVAVDDGYGGRVGLVVVR